MFNLLFDGCESLVVALRPCVLVCFVFIMVFVVS